MTFWENIGEVRQKVLSGWLQVHDVACLGYGVNALEIVRKPLDAGQASFLPLYNVLYMLIRLK